MRTISSYFDVVTSNDQKWPDYRVTLMKISSLSSAMSYDVRKALGNAVLPTEIVKFQGCNKKRVLVENTWY